MRPLLPKRSQKVAPAAILLVAGAVAIVSRTTTGAIIAAAIFLAALAASIVRLRRLLADTERAREEEAQRKATLQTVLSSIGDAVMVADADGSITFLNPVAEQLTGWPSAEALKRPIGEVFRAIDQNSRTPVENPALVVLSTGESATLANHAVLLARDGREIPIDDSAAPIRGSRGALFGVVLAFRDVTSRRLAQLALRYRF